MPNGPNVEKRPADVIGNAVKIMRVVTGEESDTIPDDGKNKAAQVIGQLGGACKVIWTVWSNGFAFTRACALQLQWLQD